MKAKVIKTGEIVDVYHESQHGQITNIYKESVLVNGRMWDEKELDFNYVMKANEAPEKIWVHELSAKELDVPLKEYHIEYVREDAFIEKATEYLSYHLDTSKIDVNYKFEFIEEFRKHLKGE